MLAATHRTAEDLEMPRLRRLVDTLAGRHGDRPTAAPPVAAPIRAVLRRDGDEWRVAYGSETFRLKDVKGFGYLATLLRHPDVEFHALDLGGAAVPAGAPAGREIADEGLVTRDLGDAGELLDAEARAAYKDRLADLQIGAGSPALGEHLAAAVRTGFFCVYSPDPRLPISRTRAPEAPRPHPTH